MKKLKLTFFILFLLGLLSNKKLLGQTTFSASPAITTYNHFGVDISDNFFVIPFNLDLKNDSTDLLKIRWHRIMDENCPLEWTFDTEDKNFFFLSSLTSNVDDNLGTYVPMDMESGESSDYKIFFSPNQVNGCCSFQIEFTEIGNPEKLFDVAYFDIRLNATSSNCLFTSDKNLEKATFEFFPNPVSNYLKIETDEKYEELRIHSIDGQLLKTIIYSTSNEYDLTDLPSGIFTLSIFTKNNLPQVFKLVKI